MRPVDGINPAIGAAAFGTHWSATDFSWICEGVRSSRKRAETSYYQRTGSDFWQTQKQARPESVKNAVPAVKTPRPEAKSTSAGATRSVKPKRTERPSAAQKASAAQSGAKSVSVPTAAGHSASEADAGKHSEWSKPKPEPKQEHAAQQSEAKEVHQSPHSNWKQNGSRKLENLRAAMQKTDLRHPCRCRTPRPTVRMTVKRRSRNCISCCINPHCLRMT